MISTIMSENAFATTGWPLKSGAEIDEDAELDAAHRAIEVAVERSLQLREDVETRRARGRLPLLQGELGSDPAKDGPLAAEDRRLPGHEGEVLGVDYGLIPE